LSEEVAMHEAIKRAIAAIEDIYKDEELSDVDVEEIDRDDTGDWLITIGFARPKTRRTLGGLTFPMRTLKTVTVDHYTGAFKAMKMYQSDK
jgi:hypothetical protein